MPLYSRILSPSRGQLTATVATVAFLFAQGCGKPFESCEDSHTCGSGGTASANGSNAAEMSGGSGNTDSTNSDDSGTSGTGGGSTQSSASSTRGTDGSNTVCAWDDCTWNSDAAFAE